MENADFQLMSTSGTWPPFEEDLYQVLRVI